MSAICLTDSPRVVELKREFRALDAEDVDLMHPANELTRERFARLQTVRQRKLVIATEIFGQPSTKEETHETSAA